LRIRVAISRAGDRGLLALLDEGISAAMLASAAQALADGLRAVAAVPGHSSVLLLFATEAPGVDGEIEIDVPTKDLRKRTEHSIAVSFAPSDAPDLDDVLQKLALSRTEFIETLRRTELRVRFSGFLPGFAYLDGLPKAWNLPRRPTSRRLVPRGSFGLAAGMAGFYPSDSPGGWNLVGRSSAVFWDPWREPPALLRAGDVVRIDPVEAVESPGDARDAAETNGDAIATCISPGQHTLIVPMPAIERYRRGVAAGGAFDAALAQLANRNAGNVDDAAVLECSLVGPELAFTRDCRIAWEGGVVQWEVDGRIETSRALMIRAGERLKVGRISESLRGWLAISGGVATCSAPFAGPQRLMRDSIVRSASRPADAQPPEPLRRDDRSRIAVLPGPHEVASLGALLDVEWLVTPALDRTGIRLEPLGPRVEAPASIPSCGMQFGTVQLHPNGDLVVMGPDHPITGGYLQPFTVLSSELWKLAALQPGERVKFTPR
jgi:KipI family sensor histidine kinase inhibitor